MFSKTNQLTKSSQVKKAHPSIIAHDMNILGNLISEGAVDIDGRIEGNVKAASVTIRQNARIKGDVHAESIQIYGEVKGLIKAKVVHLFASCRVEGIIMHESISIEDGAFVDGKFKRTDKVFVDDTEMEFGEEDEHGNVKVLEHIRLVSDTGTI